MSIGNQFHDLKYPYLFQIFSGLLKLIDLDLVDQFRDANPKQELKMCIHWVTKNIFIAQILNILSVLCPML